MINEYDASRSTNPATDSTPGAATNDEVISILNGLIETCKDGQQGFAEAAEGVDRSDLKSLFYEFSQQRSQFAGELQSLVQTLGGDPEKSGSVSGAIHRGWMNLKAAIAGNDEKAILNECERGEDSAKNAYQDALTQALPAYIAETVQTQSTSVIQAHDRIKALRDAANSSASSSATSGRSS